MGHRSHRHEREIAVRVLHDRLTTVVFVLVPQTLENAFRRVPPLAMHLTIALQNLVNNRQELVQLRPPQFRQSIPRWLRMIQHLLQRLPTNVVLPTCRTLADLAVQHTTANLGP